MLQALACTLLYHELRDYSLGQIALAVFRALFAITQLVCHVSALLTSACIQVLPNDSSCKCRWPLPSTVARVK